MGTEYDLVSEESKETIGFSAVIMKRAIVIDADSRDPLAASPAEVIPAMTPMAPVSGGKYKAIRRTLADGTCTTGQKVVPVAETTMFAVGDVIQMVAASTPTAAASAMGTIDSIVAGVSVTLVANSSTQVDSGDIVEVAENALADDAVLLLSRVDLRNAEAVAVDKGAAGVIEGQCVQAALNYCAAGGIALTRLEVELDRMDLVPATAGS